MLVELTFNFAVVIPNKFLYLLSMIKLSVQVRAFSQFMKYEKSVRKES
jgi:hypothetical protein